MPYSKNEKGTEQGAIFTSINYFVRIDTQTKEEK